MCIGEVSSAIRKNRDKLPPIHNPYNEDFFKQLEPFIPHLKEAKFYGGEPFLINEYYKIWELIRKLNPKLKMFVITNGTIWNEKVKRTIYGGKFDVAVSIDAIDKEILEKIRKNVKKDELIENIYHFKNYVDKVGTSLTLSFTIQKENWLEFPKMINFANEINAHLFVSYLETPIQFAISTFEKEELQNIKNKLSNLQFPSVSRAEKHNLRCYIDFINFLNFNIENKKKTYVDYRYGEIENIKTIELFRQEMQQYLKAHYPSNSADLLQKFNVLESFLNSDEERRNFYKLIFLPPISAIVNSLIERSVEDLYQAFLIEIQKWDKEKK
jgi:MoaA/NifB/PqqE/SkfB family radical SAM enzyme